MTEPDRFLSDHGDASLISRVALGDEEAVARFYHAYADAVFRFIYRRVRENYEDAEEITQDTFLAATACASTYDHSCAVLTWLCGIARLRVTDFYRRQGRRKRIPPDQVATLDEGSYRQEGKGSELDELPARLDTARLVDLIMAQLREEEREVLLLRYVEELSVREIARLMKRSEKAIESLLARARRKAAKAAAPWL